MVDACRCCRDIPRLKEEQMNAIKRTGLVLLAALVALPAQAEARERRHDGGRDHYRQERGRHWDGDRRDHGDRWQRRHRDFRGHHGFRGRDWEPRRSRHHWRHDRGRYYHYRPHRRPGTVFVDPYGRFFFRMFD
jgi:hypothetical protein